MILDLKQYIYILTYKLQKLKKAVAPDNHQSLQARHGTKSSSAILIKHFKKLYNMILNLKNYNTFNIKPEVAQ